MDLLKIDTYFNLDEAAAYFETCDAEKSDVIGGLGAEGASTPQTYRWRQGKADRIRSHVARHFSLREKSLLNLFQWLITNFIAALS